MKNLTRKILAKFLTREIITYTIFGVLTTIVSFLTFALFFHVLGFGTFVSNTTSHAVAILFAYVTNKIWVFRALNFKLAALLKEFATFVSSRLASYIISTVLLLLLIDLLRQNPYLSWVFTSVIVVILNYVWSKLLVFK